MMEQQDRTLTDISGTVGLLREQAQLMGREVYEQNQCVDLQPFLPLTLTLLFCRLLDELDQHVDSTSSRLAKAQKRMDRFVRENSAFTSVPLLAKRSRSSARLDLELAHLHSHDCALHLAVYHPLRLGASRFLRHRFDSSESRADPRLLQIICRTSSHTRIL